MTAEQGSDFLALTRVVSLNAEDVCLRPHWGVGRGILGLDLGVGSVLRSWLWLLWPG